MWRSIIMAFPKYNFILFLGCILVTTARKAVTIILSFLVFQKPFSFE